MLTNLENEWIMNYFRKNNGLKDLLYGLWHTILHRCNEQEVRNLDVVALASLLLCIFDTGHQFTS